MGEKDPSDKYMVKRTPKPFRKSDQEENEKRTQRSLGKPEGETCRGGKGPKESSRPREGSEIWQW